MQNVLQTTTIFANDDDAQNDITKLRTTFRFALELIDNYHKTAIGNSVILVTWIVRLFKRDDINADRLSKMSIPGVIRKHIMEQILEIGECLLRLNVPSVPLE